MNELTVENKELARKIFERTPYLKLLGMEFIEVESGRAVIKLSMREELRQPHGLLHGGATISVIDTATAFAVATLLADGEKASTVDLTTHFLRPVVDGFIICEAKIVRAGKRLFSVSADVHDQNGKQIATALATYSKV